MKLMHGFYFNAQKKGQSNALPVAKQNGHVKGNAGSSSSSTCTSNEGAHGPFPAVLHDSSAFVEDQHRGCSQPAGPEAAERRKKSERNCSYLNQNFDMVVRWNTIHTFSVQTEL